MNNFKKNKYIMIKSAISKELASFICNYFLLKKEAVYYMYENNIVSVNNTTACILIILILQWKHY